MTLQVVRVIVEAVDPELVHRFWAKAVDWGATGVEFEVVAAVGAKAAKNRIHLDLASGSLGHQRELVGRLEDLGARAVDIGQGEVPWVVMADPEGNEFCVLEPRDVYRGTGALAAIVVDCDDPAASARLWGGTLGWTIHTVTPELASLRAVSGAGPFLELLHAPGPRDDRVRLEGPV